MVGEGGIQIAVLGREYRAVAEKVSNEPGISCPAGQLDGFIDLGQCGRQVAMLVPEPAQLRQCVGGDGVIGEATGDPDSLAG